MGDKKDEKLGHLLIMSFCFLLLGGMMVFFLDDQIKSGVRWIRVAQLYLAAPFTDQFDGLRQQLMAIPPNQLTWQQIWVASKLTLSWWKWFFMAGIIVMAVVAYSDKIPNKNFFVRKFKLPTLLEEMSKAFPVLSPILKYNPMDHVRILGQAVPAKLPLFAEALAPEEWIAFYDIPRPNDALDEDALRRAFVRQLGKRFTGVSSIPIYGQVLFAAFAMKAHGQRKESDEFLGEIATCWDPKQGLRLSKHVQKRMADVIADPKIGRVLEKVCFQHAFTTTALLRALKTAREQGGVLAPAQFLWLRGVDRHLWYPLNNLGRSAFHAEAAGAMAHYRAEIQADRPIPNPQLDAAVQAMVNYFKKSGFGQVPAKAYDVKVKTASS